MCTEVGGWRDEIPWSTRCSVSRTRGSRSGFHDELFSGIVCVGGWDRRIELESIRSYLTTFNPCY